MTTPNENDRGTWTSASSAQADLLCAGRHTAQQAAMTAETNGLLAAKDDSEDAVFGRNVHAALCAGSDAGLTPKEAELFDSCRKIEAKLLTKAFGAVDPAKAQPLREKRLWIAFGQLRHSGQPDAVHRKGARALIVDYKTGPNEAPASSRNQQLRDLAVLTYYNTVMLADVWVAIIQPLVTHEPEVTVYDKAAIQQSKLLMEARVKASNDPASPRTPGTTQCQYCRAQRICAEYQAWAGAKLPMPKSIVDVPLINWTPQDFATFEDNRSIAQKWLDMAHTAAMEFAKQNPGAIPGYELKPGNVVEKIIDPQGVFDRFAAIGGTLEEFMKCLSVYKTRLVPFVKAHTNAKGKLLDEHMESLVRGCTEESQNQPSLRKVKE